VRHDFPQNVAGQNPHGYLWTYVGADALVRPAEQKLRTSRTGNVPVPSLAW
jgi:hypothetical protein